MKDLLNPCKNCKHKTAPPAKEPCLTCVTDKKSEKWDPEGVDKNA